VQEFSDPSDNSDMFFIESKNLARRLLFAGRFEQSVLLDEIPDSMGGYPRATSCLANAYVSFCLSANDPSPPLREAY